jgi:hypothetical protein
MERILADIQRFGNRTYRLPMGDHRQRLLFELFIILASDGFYWLRRRGDPQRRIARS